MLVFIIERYSAILMASSIKNNEKLYSRGINEIHSS